MGLVRMGFDSVRRSDGGGWNIAGLNERFFFFIPSTILDLPFHFPPLSQLICITS